MYTAAVYNYFNSGRRTKRSKYQKGIPIPKSSKNTLLKKCKLCGRKFQRVQMKHDETDAENREQSGNVCKKVFLIWKYAKSLSRIKLKRDSKKCSFKVINHKSYKKRSLHQEIISTTSMLSQICQICEKHNIQMIKSEELKAEEYVLQEYKSNGKMKHRKPRLLRSYIQHNKLENKTSPSNNLANSIEEIKYTRGKKRSIKMCTKSSRSSFKIKRKKCNFTKTTAFKRGTSGKKNQKKQDPKRALLPKKKFNTNKKKRLFLKENRKKVHKFASWQYMQHALSSVGEETITNFANEDKTPVYLTFEEYCLILEAIDTRGNTTDKYNGGDFDRNIEEVAETSDTNTSELNVSTEDVATNTDLLVFEHIENTSTTTEQRKCTKEEVTNTEPVKKSTKTDTINDLSNKASAEFMITDDYFEVNDEETKKEILTMNIETLSKLHRETFDEANKISKQLTNNEKIKENNDDIHQKCDENEVEPSSLDDINEIGQSDTFHLPEQIEEVEKTNEEIEQTKDSIKGNDQLNRQTEPPLNYSDKTQDQQDEDITVANKCPENDAERGQN